MDGKFLRWRLTLIWISWQLELECKMYFQLINNNYHCRLRCRPCRYRKLNVGNEYCQRRPSPTHSSSTRATTQEIDVSTQWECRVTLIRIAKTHEDWLKFERTTKRQSQESDRTPNRIATNERTAIKMRKERIRFLYLLKWKVNFPGNPNRQSTMRTPHCTRTNGYEMKWNTINNSEFTHIDGPNVLRQYCAFCVHDNFQFIFPFSFCSFNANVVCAAREMKIVIPLYGWHQTLNFSENMEIIIKKNAVCPQSPRCAAFERKIKIENDGKRRSESSVLSARRWFLRWKLTVFMSSANAFPFAHFYMTKFACSQCAQRALYMYTLPILLQQNNTIATVSRLSITRNKSRASEATTTTRI